MNATVHRPAAKMPINHGAGPRRHRPLALAVGALWLSTAALTHAFPPAPYHNLHGLVRNEFGEPLDLSSGQVILETPAGLSPIKSSIAARVIPGVNYSLDVPMDSGVAPDQYQPTALRPFLPFKLKVRIGTITYLPIEMKGDYSNLGEPSESTRIDLTLGEDSDGDGLPDAWERALITASGGKLTLADIKPDGDFDGDGIPNLDEYLAGTYAFNPADGFSLTMVGADASSSVLEFLAIRGRTYSIQGSADLSHWNPVTFRVLAAGNSTTSGSVVENYAATDVRKVRVEVPHSTEAEAYNYFKVFAQ